MSIMTFTSATASRATAHRRRSSRRRMEGQPATSTVAAIAAGGWSFGGTDEAYYDAAS